MGRHGAGGPVVALRVGAFDVEVLGVAVHGGVAPGDVLVVAGGDQRHAGQADAGDMEAGRGEIHLIPDAGHLSG